MKQHTLAVLRAGHFRGEQAVYTICLDDDCPNKGKDGTSWSGWFTESEVTTTCDHDVRCCMIHDYHHEPHRLCPQG